MPPYQFRIPDRTSDSGKLSIEICIYMPQHQEKPRKVRLSPRPWILFERPAPMDHSLSWKRESGLRCRGDTLAKKLVRVVLILVSGQYQILFEEASHAYHLPISLAV